MCDTDMLCHDSFSSKFSPINLNRIQYWISNNRLDPSKPITMRELNKSRCIHGVAEDGVKLLARGAEELTIPIHIVVSRASAAAIEAVEKETKPRLVLVSALDVRDRSKPYPDHYVGFSVCTLSVKMTDILDQGRERHSDGIGRGGSARVVYEVQV